jgi:heme/copper-type cytochrome/quinol oxidase subunit 2
MPCSATCLLATALIIAMIYFQNATTKSKIVQEYKKQLPSNLQNLYEKISAERLRLNYYGYTLGLILSLIIIFYNYNSKKNKLQLAKSNTSLVCLVIVVSFFTNYFYYILSPKSTYMLEHINSPEQTKAWLAMYREMQYNYHFGFIIGIIAVGVLAFAFRC